MDNRFGVKDALVLVLVLAVLVSVWLGIQASNRQWDLMQDIKSQLAEQTSALRQVNDQLASGISVNGGGAGTQAGNGNPPLTVPFPREFAARELPGFADGDWLVDAFGQTVGKLTPLISTDTYQDTIESYCLEALIEYDAETLEWKPLIAQDWSVSEDGLTIAFDLRTDVHFADGVPLTAADVVFTYEMCTNPEINAPRLVSYYENVESCVAEGDYRVVFTLKEPYFQALSVTGGTRVMPKHFYEQFTPDEYNESTGLLFGSGPYQVSNNPDNVEDWEPGSGKIELVRNENYWGPRPPLDRLIWLEREDETVRLTEFRNNEIDLYVIRAENFPQLMADESLTAKSELMRYTSIRNGYRYIGWNQVRNNKPYFFADVRVRRAMTMMTNREEMTEQLLNGLASVVTGPFHPLSPQGDPTIEPIPFDPEGAVALLAEAGYRDTDGDGVLESPDGVPFRFRLTYPSGSQFYEQMAFYLRDAYARAGVILEPDPTEWNTMLQKLDERDFDVITLGWGGVVESDPKQIFHSDNVGDGGDNYVGYVNTEVDALIDEARVTVDAAERTELWHRVHQLLHEDQPYTFLFTGESVLFLDDRVQNAQATKLGLSRRTELYVPTGQQRWTR